MQLDLFGVSPHQNRRKKNSLGLPRYVIFPWGIPSLCFHNFWVHIHVHGMEFQRNCHVIWQKHNMSAGVVLFCFFTFLCAKQTPTFCNFMMRSRLRLLHFIAAILFLSRLFFIVAGSSCFGVYEKRKLSLILKFCKNIPLVSWKTVILAPILWWMELLA